MTYQQALLTHGKVAYETGQKMIVICSKRTDSVNWKIHLSNVVASGTDKTDDEED